MPPLDSQLAQPCPQIPDPPAGDYDAWQDQAPAECCAMSRDMLRCGEGVWVIMGLWLQVASARHQSNHAPIFEPLFGWPHRLAFHPEHKKAAAHIY